MADVPFPTNLLPSYQTPQAMIQAAANTASTQAGTQNTIANTGLIGAQTQGAGLNNQLLQSQLDYRQQLPASMAAAVQSSAPPAPGSLADGGIDPDQIQAHANARFYVNPAWTQQEAAAMNNAMLSGQPGATDAVKGMHDRRVQAQQSASTQDATNAYDSAYDVANAPPGAALERLNRGGDQAQAAAKKIAATAKDKGWTPEQTDQHARDVADEIGGSSFVFSKYAADAKRDTDGILKDARGRQVLESTQSGLSAPQQAERQIKLAEPVVYGNQLPQPIGAASGISGPPTNPPQAAAPKQPASPASSASSDPVLDKALSDPSYRFQQPYPKPTTQEQQAANVDAQKANITASQTLKADSDKSVAAAASAQTYLQAAKAIIDSKGAAVGTYGGLIAKASSFLGDYKGDASNYQELAKYLNNAAIAAAKGNYGSGLTEKELELQLTGASPSVDKTPGALSNLVNANLRNTKYTLDTANRVVPYLNHGNDPTNFNKWNQSTWNQSAAVNAPKSTSTTMPTGDKLNAYASAHFGGDTAKAQSYLQSQGFK